jgi:hypothetical protein
VKHRDIVFKASPRRRLVVRAFFEPRRRARHGILAYGVALHPKSSPCRRLCPRRTPHAREHRRKTARGGGKSARGRAGSQGWRVLERGNAAHAGKAGSARSGEGKSRPRLCIPLLAGSRAPGGRGLAGSRALAGEGREERGEEKRATGASTWKLPAPSAQLHPSPPQSPPDPPASGSVTASVRASPLPPLFALPVFLPPSSVLPLLPLLCCVGNCLCHALCSFFPLLLLLCSAGCMASPRLAP